MWGFVLALFWCVRYDYYSIAVGFSHRQDPSSEAQSILHENYHYNMKRWKQAEGGACKYKSNGKTAAGPIKLS